MTFAAGSVTDRILAIIFPISAFVAAGFEHCVANMFLIPVGILAALDKGVIDSSQLFCRRAWFGRVLT